MFLRPQQRDKDGKRHTSWSLVETIRTADGPRQRTLCHLGELNESAQARWLKTIDVFNDAGERHQLKLCPSDIAPPPDAQLIPIPGGTETSVRCRSTARREKELAMRPSADIILPTTDGREIRLRRVTQPTPEQQQLLDQLDITIPTHLEWHAECRADFVTS